ncbi:MAG TPA: hypothetical protein VG318_18650 [Actinomycetota bacterium]|nr:hypothetical protein [Actinomycetota bacterium]
MTRKKKTAIDGAQAARDYIDQILAINRRHGMGGDVSEETYNRAVEKAERAVKVRSARGVPSQ